MPLPSPLVPEVVVIYAEKHRAFTRRNMERAATLTAKGRDSFPEKMQITGNNRGWLAETGSQVTAHTTIQSSGTAKTVLDRKEAVSAGILPPIFNVPRSLPT
jgi:hypothetical protein